MKTCSKGQLTYIQISVSSQSWETGVGSHSYLKLTNTKNCETNVSDKKDNNPSKQENKWDEPSFLPWEHFQAVSQRENWFRALSSPQAEKIELNVQWKHVG